jgi:hypothetical protein
MSPARSSRSRREVIAPEMIRDRITRSLIIQGMSAFVDAYRERP